MHFLEFLEPTYRHRRFAKCCTALGEVNPQNTAFGCKQLSGCALLSRYQKSPYMPLIFDELYFLRMPQVISSDFCWIVKLRWCSRAYTIPCAFFGVLRTFYRHRRFAKCLTALSEFNPQNMAFGCKQLSGRVLLSRYQKSPYMPLIFDELYFLRMYPSYILLFLLDCKIEVMFQRPYYSLCIFWSS